MLAPLGALAAVRPHQHAHIFSGISEPGGEPDVVPRLSGGEIVAGSLKRHCRKGLDQRRDDGQASLAHLPSALGVVAIAFAQQLVRALDVLGHEAHRDHGPVPLQLVRYGGQDKGDGRAPVDRRSLRSQMIGQDPSHLLDVDVADRRIQRLPRPAPRVARQVSERLFLAEAEAHLVGVRHAWCDRVVAPNPSRLRLCARRASIAAHGAGKPETELDRAILRLPGPQATELKARIGHHGL